MKIAVMGSGGVGGYFGARLARAGLDVTFIARGEHLAAMQRQGLEVRSALGDFRVEQVKATSDPATIGPVDIVLFAVKSWDTEEAAHAIEPLAGSETAVISLQNGVGSDKIIRSVVHQGYAPGGVCYIGSTITQPGVITHTGTIQKLIFGDDQGRCAGIAKSLLDACKTAGIDAEVRPDIETAKWEKFVFLVGLSAVTTATRLTIGPVRSNPQTRRLLLEVMREVIAVGRARGIPLDPRLAEDRLAFCDGLPEDMTSSMHKDLQRGGRLEVDWLSGDVVRLGAEAGVSAPVNAVLAALLSPFSAGVTISAATT